MESRCGSRLAQRRKRTSLELCMFTSSSTTMHQPGKRSTMIQFITESPWPLIAVWFSLLGIEHENPVIFLAVGRRLKFLGAFVGILINGFPRFIARIVPLRFHLRGVELVHVNADGLADRCVGDYEAPVFGSRRNDATCALALLG